MTQTQRAAANARHSRLALLVLAALIAAFAVACGGSSKPKDLLRDTTAPARTTPQSAAVRVSTPAPAAESPSPTASPSPAPTASPTSSPTPEPTATATPEPPPVNVLADGTHGYVVASGTLVYADASTQSAVVGRLRYEQQLDLLARVRGERFVVGSQNWPMAIQDWSNLWYKTPEGYVYSAYVWVPKAGQVLPESLGAGERWVNVNVATQTLTAMVGDRAVYNAGVTTGKNGYETPTGHWRVNYQVPNETMTSGQAGINDPAEHYDVKNVLFTQYFDGLGDALHLNYWQPASVFGDTRTSHGCVGLYIQDAQWIWMFGQTGMRVEINSNGRILPPPAPAPQQPAQRPVQPAAPAPTQRPVPPTLVPVPSEAPVQAPARPTPRVPAPAAPPTQLPASTLAPDQAPVATAPATTTVAPRIATQPATQAAPIATAPPATLPPTQRALLSTAPAPIATAPLMIATVLPAPATSTPR